MKRTRGRARRGERAIRVVQGRRRNNFTVAFAVSSERGLVHHELTQGGMTGDRFQTFVANMCALYPLQHGEQCAIICDNAAAHRRAADMILPEGFQLTFLPPYSPFLNIVENAFSIWKAAVKRELSENRDNLNNEPGHDRRMMHLANIAEVCIQEVNVEAMANAFRHMQTYLPRCWSREDIYY